MRLLSLNLENFRNIESASLKFGGDRIFFLGSNGQGKTNLLEAIGLSATLRSFRKNGMDGLVREGEERSRLFFRFSAEVNGEHEILLDFRPKGEKNLELNGKKIARLGEYLGLFPAVTLSSRDFRIVREGPADRRKWLDILLSSSSKEYFEVLQSYHRSLRERNALLKQGGGDSELNAFEHSLAESTLILQSLREEAIPTLGVFLGRNYSSLTGGTEEAGLSYQPDLPQLSLNQLLARYSFDRERDRLFGSTRRGPHRDDFQFFLNQRDARIYASEGQQRGLVLALRLAEFYYLHESLNKLPLVLADDVLGELDQNRKANFRCLLPSQAQVFATGTSYPSKEERGIWETFLVEKGSFSKC